MTSTYNARRVDEVVPWEKFTEMTPDAGLQALIEYLTLITSDTHPDNAFPNEPHQLVDEDGICRICGWVIEGVPADCRFGPNCKHGSLRGHLLALLEKARAVQGDPREFLKMVLESFLSNLLEADVEVTILYTPSDDDDPWSFSTHRAH